MSKRMPEIFTASTRTQGYVQASPRWHGTGQVHGPTETGLGAAEHNLQCEHEHVSIDAAIECGARLARSRAASWSRAMRRNFLQAPCRIEIHEDKVWHDEAPQYIKTCQAHKTHAGRLYPEKSGAEAQEWTCPWAEFVRQS